MGAFFESFIFPKDRLGLLGLHVNNEFVDERLKTHVKDFFAQISIIIGLICPKPERCLSWVKRVDDLTFYGEPSVGVHFCSSAVGNSRIADIRKRGLRHAGPKHKFAQWAFPSAGISNPNDTSAASASARQRLQNRTRQSIG